MSKPDKKKHISLEELPGIGPKTLKKLRDVGINSIEALAASTPAEVEGGGISAERAMKLVSQARSTLSVPFITAAEFAKRQESVLRLTTGSKALDNLLGGGVPSQSITEFYGEFGSGKSQLCHQLSVNAQLPIEKGGLNGKVLYIDTEATFRPQRIRQMATALNLDLQTVFNNIILAEAFTSDHQISLLEQADAIISKRNIKLIIIDSLTSHFRSEYLGREMLARRQQALNKHMYKLGRMAKVYNLVAVVTNQVMARPDTFFRDPTAPIGGHIVGHITHTRVYLRKIKPPGRIARLVASPYLPEGDCQFKITADGVRDMDEEAPPKKKTGK